MHEFKVSSLQISGTVYSASRNDFLDDLTHDINKEECEEEDGVQQEAFSREEYVELKKLTKSSCINLLNDIYQCYASQALPEEYISVVKSKCADLQYHRY